MRSERFDLDDHSAGAIKLPNFRSGSLSLIPRQCPGILITHYQNLLSQPMEMISANVARQRGAEVDVLDRAQERRTAAPGAYKLKPRWSPRSSSARIRTILVIMNLVPRIQLDDCLFRSSDLHSKPEWTGFARLRNSRRMVGISKEYWIRRRRRIARCDSASSCAQQARARRSNPALNRDVPNVRSVVMRAGPYLPTALA